MPCNFLWKIKKGPKTILDFLTLWILSSVWPGSLIAFIVGVESHRLPLAFFLAVLIGFIVTVYVWTHPTETLEDLSELK